MANCMGGIPEIIEDGYNGILTTAVTAKALADAIKKLLECCEDGTIVQYSEHAKNTALKYTIKNNCLQVDDILRSI